MALTLRLRPPPLPLVLGAVVLGTLLAVLLSPGGVPDGAAPGALQAGPVTAQRALRFTDQPDGGVRVEDADSGRTVTTIEGESGFARGVLRSLARERRRTGQPPAAPFLLQARANGQLTLADPTTGQHIDLGSFGPTNAGVFARLLNASGDTP